MFERAITTAGELRDSVVETISEAASRLLGEPDREALLEQRRALLDAPPIRLSLRERRELEEREDDVKIAAERAARDGQRLRLERLLAEAGEPTMLTAFRRELAQQEEAWVYVRTSEGALTRRSPTFRPTERVSVWSARVTKAETDVNWLNHVVAVLAAARDAAGREMA